MANRFSKLNLEHILAIIIITIYAASILSLIIFENVNPETAIYWSTGSILNTPVIVQDPGFYKLRTVEFFMILNGIAYLTIVTFVIANFVNILGRVDIKKRDMMRKVTAMEDHVIVCGYGKVGEKVCEVLDDHTLEYVVIENDSNAVIILKEKGIAVIEGDATQTRALKLAGVERAGALIATLGSDTDNIYTILTARELNTNLIIATRAVSEEVVSKMHRAGAEIVVMPEVIAGLELGKEVVGAV